MTAVDDLAAWLTQIWDEEEWWATEASRRDLGGFTPTGEHWHWECGDDHPVTPDPLTQGVLECAEGNFRVSLRSVEHYPTTSGVGPLPHFALSYCEEVPAAVAGHILRHDPAAVLARIAADRQILALHGPNEWGLCGICVMGSDEEREPCVTVRLLALPHADRPGYREEWRLT